MPSQKMFVHYIICMLLYAMSGCVQNHLIKQSARHQGMNNEDTIRCPSSIVNIQYISGRSLDYGKSGQLMNEPGIIFRAWSNGRVLYSKDDVYGGPPYYQTRISVEDIQHFMAELETNEVFNDNKDEIYTGPSAGYIEIKICNRGQEVRLISWHEEAERNPGLVATEKGIEVLGGRDKARVLADQGGDYKTFRLKWDLIRSKIKDIVNMSEI